MPCAIVGALACQKNSFLKNLKTTVSYCQEYKYSEGRSKKSDKKPVETKLQKSYAIELEDTILFPEGGGQPSDSGTIVLPDQTKINVLKVLRDKLTAKHITSEPIEPGTEVTLILDWDKRIDYMQQHTGQHLLSAVFDSYNLETLSWSMGEMNNMNYIELPQKISDELINEVSDKVNKLIFEAIPINVVTPDPHDKNEELDVSHIPEDYDLSKGIIRIVKIGDLDANPCCGTHLKSTSQIQAISLFHQINVRGGNSKLHFMCGSRVYKYSNDQNKLLKGIGSILSCQIEETVDKVNMLCNNYKKANQRESSLLKELAQIEANRIFNNFNNGKTIEYVFRQDPTADFLSLVQKELLTLFKGVDLKLENYTLVLVNGEKNQGGMIKIQGPQTEQISEEIKKILNNLKGGGRGNQFQGKMTTLEHREIESLSRYLNTITM